MIVNLIKPLGRGMGIAALSLLGLTACNEPNNPQVTNPTVSSSPSTITQSPATTTPVTPGTQTNQNIDIDDLAGRVEDTLDNDQTLRPFDLDADDEGNSIVLTGLVQNEAQKTRAEELARQIAPNTTIDNRIRTQ
jgi:hyperosmotically inducible periplasmic protein